MFAYFLEMIIFLYNSVQYFILPVAMEIQSGALKSVSLKHKIKYK
jgi:hypothetical protein